MYCLFSAQRYKLHLLCNRVISTTNSTYVTLQCTAEWVSSLCTETQQVHSLCVVFNSTTISPVRNALQQHICYFFIAQQTELDPCIAMQNAHITCYIFDIQRKLVVFCNAMKHPILSVILHFTSYSFFKLLTHSFWNYGSISQNSIFIADFYWRLHWRMIHMRHSLFSIVCKKLLYITYLLHCKR